MRGLPVARGNGYWQAATRSGAFVPVAACWLVAAIVLALDVRLMTSAGYVILAVATWALALAYSVAATPAGMFSLATGYVLLLGVFHLGSVVPCTLGAASDTCLESPQLPLALALVAIACVALALGVAAGRRDGDRISAIASHRGLFIAGIAISAIGATALWVGILRLGVLTAGYSGVFNAAQTTDPRLFGAGRMLFFQGLLVAAAAATRQQGKWVLVLLIGCGGPIFMLGFRGPFVVNLMALLVVWYRKDPATTRRAAAVALLGLLVLAPTVKLLRIAQVSSLREGLESTRSLDFVLEAGYTMRPLLETLERVELHEEPLWLGRSYAASLVRVVPNVSLRWSARSSELYESFPAHWISREAVPDWYEEGGGLGFSAVAEPYLNFGLPGVVVYFLLLGYGLARAEVSSERSTRVAAVVMASYGPLLWTVRNDVAELFRAVTWCAVLVIAITWVTSVRSRSSE